MVDFGLHAMVQNIDFDLKFLLEPKGYIVG